MSFSQMVLKITFAFRVYNSEENFLKAIKRMTTNENLKSVTYEAIILKDLANLLNIKILLPRNEHSTPIEFGTNQTPFLNVYFKYSLELNRTFYTYNLYLKQDDYERIQPVIMHRFKQFEKYFDLQEEFKEIIEQLEQERRTIGNSRELPTRFLTRLVDPNVQFSYHFPTNENLNQSQNLNFYFNSENRTIPCKNQEIFSYYTKMAIDQTAIETHVQQSTNDLLDVHRQDQTQIEKSSQIPAKKRDNSSSPTIETKKTRPVDHNGRIKNSDIAFQQLSIKQEINLTQATGYPTKKGIILKKHFNDLSNK